MNGATNSSDQKSGDRTTSGLVVANGLSYQLTPQISVVTQRNVRKYPANRDSYSGNGTVLIDLPTGDAYISASTSWLTFTLTATSANPVYLTAGGSALDCIDEILWKHASGKEILRNPRFNVYSRATNRFTHSQGVLDTVGSVAGFGDEGTTDLTAGATFSVPLSYLSDLFSGSQLLPPWLVSGSQLSLRLTDVVKAFYSTVTDATQFTFSNCEIFLDSVILSDSVGRKMLQQIAAGNVEMEYMAYQNYQNASGNASTNYQVDTQVSVARAVGAVGVARVTANVSNAQLDSLAPDVADLNHLQSRLGALLFPEAPLTTAADIYTYALRSMKKLDGRHETAVRFSDFKGAAAQVPGTATVYNSELITAYLQKNDFLTGSGLPTNKQSGSLIVSMRYDTSKDRTIDIYVQFMKAVKIGASQILVAE